MRLLTLASVSTAAVLSAAVADAANLISHFPFDSDFTNEVNASLDSPLQNNVAISGDAVVGGGAASFNGIDSAVVAGTNAVPGAGGGYYSGTVAFWFKAGNGIQAGNRRFIGQQNGDPASFGADNRMSFEISTNGAGSVQAFIRTADGTETNNRYKFRHEEATGTRFPTDWSNGEWTHLAFAWDVDAAGNAISQIYIDGFEVGTVVTESSLEADPVKAPLLPWESPGMFIGARNNRIAQGGSTDGQVDGLIDDMRVYDGFLTLAEIRQLPGVIPEPSTMAIVLVGATALAGRRRAG